MKGVNKEVQQSGVSAQVSLGCLGTKAMPVPRSLPLAAPSNGNRGESVSCGESWDGARHMVATTSRWLPAHGGSGSQYAKAHHPLARST